VTEDGTRVILNSASNSALTYRIEDGQYSPSAYAAAGSATFIRQGETTTEDDFIYEAVIHITFDATGELRVELYDLDFKCA
jgi:hypothetical protein